MQKEASDAVVESESFEERSKPLKIENILLKTKIAEYEEKFDELRDYVRRMEGEISLIRQRSERSIQGQLDQTKSRFFLAFADILDNLELSLRAIPSGDPFVEGIRMIHRQIEQVLTDQGLSRIETIGKVFDPQWHDAVTVQPVDSHDLHDMIVEELRPGFGFKDEVIRPAQVVVGKHGQKSTQNT